jgi:UDP-2,3-diacylglucosamine hydrolase
MELLAPPRWACVDFISDLHLQASDPQTFAAWSRYLQQTPADALFILGDLFDVWIGDDVLSLTDGFEQQCVRTLHAAAQRLDLYILYGNRDFLMGPALMAAVGCTQLPDPSVLSFAGQRWLLSHGDALCLADTDYMQFRAMARSEKWQTDFLGQALPTRLELGRAMRAQSEAHKRSHPKYVDLDLAATTALMESHAATHMVHGHTHRPARHPLPNGRERLVLSDWDLAAQPPRAEVLRLRRTHTGDTPNYTLERIPPSMAGGSAAAI